MRLEPLAARLVHLGGAPPPARLVGWGLVPGPQQARFDQLVEVESGEVAGDGDRVGRLLPGHRMVLAADVLVQRAPYRVHERGERLPPRGCHDSQIITNAGC